MTVALIRLTMPEDLPRVIRALRDTASRQEQLLVAHARQKISRESAASLRREIQQLRRVANDLAAQYTERLENDLLRKVTE
jgi:hypothetical protein